MSLPNIPSITPNISITTGQTVPLLLASIALEELALAHLLNAEAEKLQFVLGTLTPPNRTLSPATVTLDDLLAVNASIQRTLRDVIKKEMLLEFKFENVLELIAVTGSGLLTPNVFNFTGAPQTTTVPAGATTATIIARGAEGGTGVAFPGGRGAQIQGVFSVTPGETLSVIVGGQGATGGNISGGGGGGSFVWRTGAAVSLANLLVAAGGGGGGSERNAGVDATTLPNGTSGNPGGAGGIGGNGGAAGGPVEPGAGGAGILTDGGDGEPPITGGTAINAGGAGGIGRAGANGGFGGGGGGDVGGGGGGGFSGGGGGDGSVNLAIGGGGGGGSQNNGINQVNTAGVGLGDGQVIIIYS